MVVDGLTQYKIEAIIYDTESDTLTELTLGPNHDEEALETSFRELKEGLSDKRNVIESRKDELERGTTERDEEYYQ